MPNVDPDQGLTYPADPDLADNPSGFATFIGGLLSRLNKRYTNVADRTARDLAPVENQITSLATENRIDAYDGANYVSLARRAFFAFPMRTSDAAAINNSTALVSDAILTIALEANAEYFVEGALFYDSSNTADFKMSTVWPGGSSGRLVGWGLDTGGTTQVGSMKQQSTTASAANWSFVGAGVGTGNTVFCKFEGRIVVVGAGNFVVQYAQNALDATNTVVRSGSYVRATRML